MQKLLLVEDDPALQFTIQTALEEKGYAVDAVSTTGEAIDRLSDGAYPIVISDIYIDERTGLDVLNAAKKRDPRCSVILMTGRGTMETVMAATRGGVFDYIAKPFDLDVMIDAVERAEAALLTTGEEAEEEELPETQMIGNSPAMIEIYKKVARVAPTDATVIIEGETGTGKELVARMIHRFSQRAVAALRAGGLRRHPALPARKRVVRRHARRVYRRRPRPHGRLRIGPPRHRVPRRDRRHRARFPGEAACGSCRSGRSARSAPRAPKKWTCG